MTSGVAAPQLSIVLNTPEKLEETGVIGWVEVFGSSQYSIVVRPGIVMIDGACYLNPGKARILAKAIDAAARLAEDYHGLDCESDSYQDIS